ncbi:hypothetical protein LCGC14_0906960 [marine sediment metagenome]|uniref:Uncharacterized protein n=1 Tax=marine sediment metagenome TaxID=412755 RepID=A0A0F9RDQ1_9ZZZZ
MAILKFGVLVTGIRGTIGGTIFSANKGGPFARSWSKGPNPRTSRQTIQRGLMTTHSAPWLALTQAQRDDWDTYAADPAQEFTNSLGEAYYGSGYNWYCRINTHLLLSGRARRAVFPAAAAPAAPTLSTAYSYEPISVDFHNRITYPQFEFSNHDVIVRVAFGTRTSQLVKYRGFAGVYYTTQTTTLYTEFGLTTLAIFGQTQAASKCFFQVQKQSTEGRRSAIVTVTADTITL